ncbi:phage virion morphogenesis protein [Thioclava sp. A2]|uniref:phage virion morphogenesis protein n=1 Tax=Thioclava sp. FCG-A2 TaxID=3080562 RepID=UPI002952AFCC|nr:phage virion morphogenesis protein [Thioclava sp. A2]MDV7270829.1 phage virion morphogenesis protein [Thioclava sp. A2]
MAGVTAQLTTVGLDEAIRRLSRLEGFEMAELTDAAGAILKSSTRDRFDTKTAPDGTDWVPWSDAYDDTREDRHSLLVEEDDLRDSIASYSTGVEVHVGSNLIYAAHHHFGGDEIGSGIPARPYLGISDQDESDLADLVTGTLEGLLA